MRPISFYTVLVWMLFAYSLASGMNYAHIFAGIAAGFMSGMELGQWSVAKSLANIGYELKLKK